jgi:hypothetical protein
MRIAGGRAVRSRLKAGRKSAAHGVVSTPDVRTDEPSDLRRRAGSTASTAPMTASWYFKMKKDSTQGAARLWTAGRVRCARGDTR